jgi:hypothetical protein
MTVSSGWCMFPPGRKACPAGSRILYLSSAAPSLRATMLFIIRPIYWANHVLTTCPPFLGSPVTMAIFSYCGMSLALKDNIAIFLSVSVLLSLLFF